MFGRIFKSLREEKNVTQKDIAKYLRVSDRLVGYYENGQRMPPSDMLEKIADYFSVSIDYLLGRTDIREPAQRIIDDKLKHSGNPISNEFTKEIHTLSPESQEDLEAYIKLLKLRDMQKRNTEASDELATLD